MTYISISNFFDHHHKRWGYALAVDREMVMLAHKTASDQASNDHTSFLFDKSFSGKDYIGLFQGYLAVKHEDSVEEGWRKAIRSLDGVFDNIQANKRYSGIEVLKMPKEHTSLTIARRFPGGAELFQVKPLTGTNNDWIAERIHTSKGDKFPSSLDKSVVFLGPYDGRYKVVTLDKVLDPISAQEKVLSILMNSALKAHSNQVLEEQHGIKVQTNKPEETFKDISLYLVAPNFIGKVDYKKSGELMPA